MSAAHSATSDESVGSLLRRTREARGIPIEEAARVTRIGQSYLAALEADRFDSLPNIAYTKGFLRAYAAYLGISGDEAVAMYERSLAPLSVQGDSEEPAARRPRRRLAPPKRGRWAVPVILLALIAVAAYIFDEKSSQPEKGLPPPSAPPQEQQAVAPVLPPRTSSHTAAESPPFLPEKEKTDVSAEAGAKEGGIVLKLKVQQDCWLHITIDDAISQQYDLKAGDLIEWKANRVFALDVGNAGGIEAEFNGRQLKPFGEPGKPAHVVLKASDSTQQTR